MEVLVLWILSMLAFAAVPDAAPAPLVVTADELAELAKGKIPVRFTDDGTGGGVIGIVDVEASEDAVWAAILNVGARVGEISGLKEANVYTDSTTKKGVQWVLSVLGSRVQFNIEYDIDLAARWCRYRLDLSRENDLVDVQGAYQTYRVENRTRLVYRSETDSGRRVPGFVKRWLASDSLTEQLEGIRGRAQGN